MNKTVFTLMGFAMSFAASILFATMGVSVSTYAQARKSVEPHTVAALIAADEQWSKAEDTGDTKYLGTLLLPEYRSISSDGSTHDKATIMAHAAKNAKTTEGAATADKWRVAHPYRTSVEINGEVAILTFVLQRGIDPKPVMSCDIFVYRNGHWRALYSQHTEAEK